jgi:hypothetical protein
MYAVPSGLISVAVSSFQVLVDVVMLPVISLIWTKSISKNLPRTEAVLVDTADMN